MVWLSVDTARSAIEPVVSSTNMTSVLGRRMSASQATVTGLSPAPSTRISVIGRVAVTAPDTLPPLSVKLVVKAVLP